MIGPFSSVRRGVGSRLRGSLAGLFVGPLMVIAAIALLGWNEHRAVKASTGLHEAAGEVVEVQGDRVPAADEGKLVHLVGALTARQAIHDTALGLDFDGQALVRRHVEMYQWAEQKHKHHSGGHDTTTYTYVREWSDAAHDSGQFHQPTDHTNPPMPFRSDRLLAPDAHLGAYVLDGALLDSVDPDRILTPTAPSGWRTRDAALFRGDPDAPQVGDLRVDYSGLPVGSVMSVLAAQQDGGFAPFVTANGYRVRLAEPGRHSAAQLLDRKRRSERTLTWVLRGAGALGIFVGMLVVLGPLTRLASLVPLLGRLVGGAVMLVALLVTVPLTLGVIALAWLAVRPVVGLGLLLAAVLAVVVLGRTHRARRRARMGAETSPMPPPPPPSSTPPPPPPPPAPA